MGLLGKLGTAAFVVGVAVFGPMVPMLVWLAAMVAVRKYELRNYAREDLGCKLQIEQTKHGGDNYGFF